MEEKPVEPREVEPGGGGRYEEPETRPAAGFYFVRVLAWLPMAFFAACLIIALIAQPLTRAVPSIPVTSGLPAAPTLTPGPDRAPAIPALPEGHPAPEGAAPEGAAPEGAAPEGGTFSYKELVTVRIQECTIAFHEFFILERMASHRPEMITSDSWRDEARLAMEDFEAGCAPLGTLPEAPHAYAEAERWLKLAAGEVDSASSRFAVLMEGSDAQEIEVIASHMMLFLEYTHNAELIIDGLEEREEI